MGLIDQLQIDVSLVELERAIRRYVDELGIEMPKIVKQTFRLIMRDVMQVTAPKSNKQGRNAVARDINRAVFLLDPTKIHRKRLKKAVESRDYNAIRIILQTIKQGDWARIKQVVPMSPHLHTRVRDRRGRVTRPKWIATPDVSEHKKYVRATQGHVGFTRAGWAPAARKAGLTLPNWVARHTSPPGSAHDGTANPERPTMTAIHDGKTTENLPKGQINGVVERRAKQMHRDVTQVAHGRASRYFT